MTDRQTTDPEQLRAVAKQEAALIERAMREDLNDALTGNDPLLIEVLDYALFSGGKRIRPLLVILASRICGRYDESLYQLASAFEYLHVATLIHDDVIDHAQERRGRQSVVGVFGMAAAILAGDWLHARSMHLIGRLAGQRGLELFCQATAAMVDGEFLQLRFAEDNSSTEEQYFQVIDRKTARLIASACEIGALFGGGDATCRDALQRYGYNLGTAFQVVDDLLDYLGDPKNTGKKIGNDLVEGKMTLPLLRALKSADSEEQAVLAKLLVPETRALPETFSLVAAFVEKNGGFSSARKSAEELIQEAVAQLDVFSGATDQESRKMLTGLALYILHRNR